MKGFGPICETTASGNRAEFPLPQNCADSCASVAAVFSAATPTGLLVNWGKRGQRKETKGLAELKRYNRFQEGKVEGKSKDEFQEEGIHEGKELPKSSVKAP